MLPKKLDDKTALLSLIESVLDLQRELMDARRKIDQQEKLLKLQDDALRMPRVAVFNDKQLELLASMVSERVSDLLEEPDELVN